MYFGYLGFFCVLICLYVFMMFILQIELGFSNAFFHRQLQHGCQERLGKLLNLEEAAEDWADAAAVPVELVLSLGQARFGIQALGCTWMHLGLLRSGEHLLNKLVAGFGTWAQLCPQICGYLPLSRATVFFSDCSLGCDCHCRVVSGHCFPSVSWRSCR